MTIERFIKLNLLRYTSESKMTLDKITDFETRLAQMKDPRVRRGFIDSFHAGLVRGAIYGLDTQSIEAAAKLEARYGFRNHAQKLLSHPHYLGFGMPGAERFARYLNDIVGGNLRTEGPEIVEFSYDGKYGKKWVIKLDGKELGKYTTFGPKPGETGVIREYDGIIPGYVNEAAVVSNKYETGEAKLPLDHVVLVYSNSCCVLTDLDEKSSIKMLKTLWQRQDGHDKIPFP